MSYSRNVESRILQVFVHLTNLFTTHLLTLVDHALMVLNTIRKMENVSILVKKVNISIGKRDSVIVSV